MAAQGIQGGTGRMTSANVLVGPVLRVVSCHACCPAPNIVAVVGRTSERLRDPSMAKPESINSDCCIHGTLYVFTGLFWIFTMMKRTEIRERFEIPGSRFGDCCTAFWCHCCAVVQQENEVKLRLRPAVQLIQQPYQPLRDQMMYDAQPPRYEGDRK